MHGKTIASLSLLDILALPEDGDLENKFSVSDPSLNITYYIRDWVASNCGVAFLPH